MVLRVPYTPIPQSLHLALFEINAGLDVPQCCANHIKGFIVS